MVRYRWLGPTWDPFLDFERIEDEARRLIGAVERSVGLRSVPRPYPTINVYDAPESVVVTAELPGIDPSALDLSITQDVMTLKGTRKETEVGNATVHRRERMFGEFTRTISFPEKVDPDGVKATYKLGVLRISVPKAKETRPRQITVSGE